MGFTRFSWWAGWPSLYPMMRDYNRAEVLYYGSRPAEQYRNDPSFLFRAWGEYGAATLLPMNGQNLRREARDASSRRSRCCRGRRCCAGTRCCRRWRADAEAALDTVARLKIFATQLHDWPKQLAAVYQLLDEQGKPMAGFKAELVKLYGMPSVEQAPSEDDDDSEE